MTFWTYMLHCRGGYFYAGHTDNLERRIAAHQSGQIPGFTADHQPVELVWSQDFPTRIEALEAERRIKGWSRAKKMALIRDDWAAISRLAKSKDTVRAEPVEAPSSGEKQPFDKLRANGVGEAYHLTTHPSALPVAVDGVEIEFERTANGLSLSYRVFGALPAIVIPSPAASVRTDELWRSTCFELFIRGDGSSYDEYNFSPSGEWAAYRFESYRSGMAPLELPDPPSIETEIVSDKVLVVGVLIATDLMGDLRIGLSAVIEEKDGTKSYWALAHPSEEPDFHAPGCFAARLP